MEQFNTIFIGSGQAAWNAALPLAMAGQRVAIIEEGKFAGVCTNFGCDAKGLLDGPVKALAVAKQFAGIGLEQLPTTISWEEIMSHKHDVIDPLGAKLQELLQQAGVQVISGHGEFIDEATVVVDGKEYTADRFVVATGQRPARLAIPGQDYLHSSTDFLDLPQMPANMVFIGAGYVSLELASLAAAAGANVTIIEFAQTALRGFYAPYSQKLVKQMEADGITFYFEQTATEVSKTTTGYTLHTAEGLAIAADYIVDATGRIPNVERVGLEKAGVAFDQQGIVVNEYLQTTNKKIYASGDVIKKDLPKLTPTAAFEARYLAGLFTGQITAPIAYPVIATAAFTMPRIAQVGIAPATALADAAHYKVRKIDLKNAWDYKAMNETDAELILVFDQSARVVGAANYSKEAPEIINTLTGIIQQKLTLQELQNHIYVFPTLDYNLPFYLLQGLQ